MKTLGIKNDNSDRGEKIVIRKRLLESLTEPHVLECFAGSGKIHAECYKDVPYLGLDLKPINDGRNLLAVDNRKFLRMTDLSTWNLFDLDAYGSPWHQFLIVLKRRIVQPGETIAFALTDGLAFKMRMSDLPHGMKPYIGIPPPYAGPMPCPSSRIHHPALCRPRRKIRRAYHRPFAPGPKPARQHEILRPAAEKQRRKELKRLH